MNGDKLRFEGAISVRPPRERFVILFDGTRHRPMGRQLLTPEHPRYYPTTAPERRSLAQIESARSLDAARIPETVHEQPLFGGDAA
jgi:hypothetical protein